MSAWNEKIMLPCKLNLSNDEYHKSSGVGSSSLKRILRSPAHYLHELDNPPEPTPAMAFGTAFHEAVLEPDLFKENAVVMPKFEGTGSKAMREDWLLANQGKRVLSQGDMDTIQGMCKSILTYKTASKLLAGGASEESYFAQDPETGIVLKARPDFLRKGKIVVDLKTTTDAEPAAFAKQIANMKYHLSAALYLDVISSVLGEKYDQFIIIAVEKALPYGVSVLLLDDATIEAGRFLYRKALGILKKCRDDDYYPGYPDEIISTAIPHWAFPAETNVTVV